MDELKNQINIIFDKWVERSNALPSTDGSWKVTGYAFKTRFGDIVSGFIRCYNMLVSEPNIGAKLIDNHPLHNALNNFVNRHVARPSWNEDGTEPVHAYLNDYFNDQTLWDEFKEAEAILRQIAQIKKDEYNGGA